MRLSIVQCVHYVREKCGVTQMFVHLCVAVSRSRLSLSHCLMQPFGHTCGLTAVPGETQRWQDSPARLCLDRLSFKVDDRCMSCIFQQKEGFDVRSLAAGGGGAFPSTLTWLNFQDWCLTALAESISFLFDFLAHTTHRETRLQS